MKLKFSIDGRAFVAALLRAPELVAAEIRVEGKDQLAEVQRRARRVHRYRTRGGAAERSVQTEVSSSGFSGSVYLDDGIAEYSKYLHEGHHSWKADRFLDAAMTHQTSTFIKGIEGAIARGIKRAGL